MLNDIETSLVTFKRSFHSYLMEKTVKLYSYLKHSVELFPKESLAVNNSRVLNTRLSRKINRFIEAYLDKGTLVLEEGQYKEFEKELKGNGRVYERRAPKPVPNIRRQERRKPS